MPENEIDWEEFEAERRRRQQEAVEAEAELLGLEPMDSNPEKFPHEHNLRYPCTPDCNAYYPTVLAEKQAEVARLEEQDRATDPVNHPSHYGGADNPYEVIKVAEAWEFDKDAYLFNVLKYIARPGKGKYLEDLKKARFYLDRKIQNLEGE
jgi:hypothetical protein